MALSRALRLVALMPLLVTASVWAMGDACRPVTVVQPSDALTLELTRHSATPRIEARLARDVDVSTDLKSMSLQNGTGEALLQQPVIVKHVLGYNDLTNGSGNLAIDGDPNAQMVGKAAGRSFLLGFRDGKPQTADRRTFDVIPPVAKESAFTVLPGARVVDAGAGRVRIREGARIVWRPDPKQPLEFKVALPIRLEETSTAASTQRVTVVRPMRAPPGGTLIVQVSAPGFDFRLKPVAFCFSSAASEGEGYGSASARVKLVSQSGDTATFQVEVPSLEAPAAGTAAGLSLSANWLSGEGDIGITGRALGVAATLRVIALEENIVAVYGSDRFTISNARAAFIISVGLLGVLLALSALLLRQLNLFAIVSALIRHESGRYSLSNLQIFMWTILVIFALCFNWVTTGELLDISPGILVLLGISGTTSVLARTLDKVEQESGQRTSVAPTTGSPLKDLLSDGEGKFDLLRFQMLGFTVFTWFYVLVSVLQNLGLPPIPESFFMLMGISNTAYIGGKLPFIMGDKNSQPAAAEATPERPPDAEKLLTEAQIKQAQTALDVSATGVLDAATREAVKKFKLDNGIAPANGTVDKLLLDLIAAKQ